MTDTANPCRHIVTLTQGSGSGRNIIFLLTFLLSIASVLWFIYLPMSLDAWLAADFKVFWTAGQIQQSLVYDFDAVTAANPGAVGLRPFLSPPSLLLAMKPFFEVSLWSGFALWTAASLISFAWISSRIAGKAALLLLCAAPAFHWAVIAGQVTLLVGALIYLGVLCLSRRPVTAGLLFACVALLKPQAALLIPLALLAGGHHRALGAAIISGVLAGLTSVSLQGPDLWIDWLRAIGTFGEMIRSNGFIAKGITPAALAYSTQATGSAELAIRAGGILLGLTCCWLVFKRSVDPALRGGAIICGALLCTPYAMSYEAAPLLPAAGALLTRPGTRLITCLAAGLVVCFPYSSLGIAFFGVGAIFAVIERRSSPASPACLPGSGLAAR